MWWSIKNCIEKKTKLINSKIFNNLQIQDRNFIIKQQHWLMLAASSKLHWKKQQKLSCVSEWKPQVSWSIDNKPKMRLYIYNFKCFANTRQWWHDATTKTIYSMRSVQNCIATKTKIQLYFLNVEYFWKYKTNSKWFGSFNKKSHKQGCISWLDFKKYNLVFGFLQTKYEAVTAW